MEPGLEVNCVVGSGFQGFGVAPSHMLHVSKENTEICYTVHAGGDLWGGGGIKISVVIMFSFL